MEFEKIFEFMKICRSRGLCVVAVEWDPAEGLTAYTSNPRCDVGGEAGLEPFDDCEFPCGSPTRNAFEEMEKALTGAPAFFLKSPVVRYSTAQDFDHGPLA